MHIGGGGTKVDGGIETELGGAALTLRGGVACGEELEGTARETEEAGDRRVAEVGQVAEHVHRDLPGGDERPLAALALQRSHVEVQDACPSRKPASDPAW